MFDFDLHAVQKKANVLGLHYVPFYIYIYFKIADVPTKTKLFPSVEVICISNRYDLSHKKTHFFLCSLI